MTAGPAAPTVVELLAGGALDAHACVALGDGASLARGARELTQPFLAVCAGGDAAAAADELRQALSRNTRLGSDYFVADFEASDDFVLRPRGADDARSAERAVALVQSWVDRFVPERLGRPDRGGDA